MELKFRALRADEIECRVAQVTEKYVSILLYKDARCDQRLLDETVGCMNWQRHHSRENKNCIVSIWDSEKSQWIEKEDTGTESYTEAEKGVASDSFKRACFNWGIGRELYTAPRIMIWADKCKIVNKGGKYACYDRFTVGTIRIEGGVITYLTIMNGKNKAFEYGYPTSKSQPVKTDEEKNEELISNTGSKLMTEREITAIKKELSDRGINFNQVLQNFKKDRFEDLTVDDEKAIITMLKNYDAKKGAKK